MPSSVDQQTFTFVFERNLAATCEEVFDAWTQPEQVAEWWDPTGERLVACDIDLRPGGSFRFVNKAGGQHHFEGKYSVVERPVRLVFDAVGSIGTVLLEGNDKRTRMRVTIRCASKAQLEQFVHMGIASNTDDTLDNLVRYIDRVRTAA